jgi:hypothetical protein
MAKRHRFPPAPIIIGTSFPALAGRFRAFGSKALAGSYSSFLELVKAIRCYRVSLAVIPSRPIHPERDMKFFYDIDWGSSEHRAGIKSAKRSFQP